MLTQQARIEDITLKEDYGNAIITQDDDFGDMGFGMNTLLMSDDFFAGDERKRNNMEKELDNDEFNHETSTATFTGIFLELKFKNSFLKIFTFQIKMSLI